MAGRVVAVACAPGHRFSKPVMPHIELLAGLGVAGDAHAGVKVKHRSRVVRDPSQPNLRQVHLIHAELLDELAARGFKVAPGDLGENITTRGIDLLALAADTHLHLGASAVVRITGLRNPCVQLDRFQSGLMAAVLARDAAGRRVRKAGVMGVVVAAGPVAAGDRVRIEPARSPHRALEPV